VRVRDLAARLNVEPDGVLLWLMEHAPAAGIEHPADCLPADLEARVRAAYAPPAPVEESGTRAQPDGANARAAASMLAALRAQGHRRLLVVGGAPATVGELRALVGDAIDLRTVDGTAHRHAGQAAQDLRWCDVAIIWGGTILAHRVSRLYTDRRAQGDHRVPRKWPQRACGAG
jgi:hypothetical protein